MSNEQNGLWRWFTAQEKVAVLREHLVEKVLVSEVCNKHGLNQYTSRTNRRLNREN